MVCNKTKANINVYFKYTYKKRIRQKVIYLKKFEENNTFNPNTEEKNNEK